MLPNETKVVEDKRHLLNYFSNQVHDQVKDMLNNNYKDLCEHLMEVSLEQKQITTKWLNNWNNLIDHFKGMDFNDQDDEAEMRQEQEEEEKKAFSPKKIETRHSMAVPQRNHKEFEADNEHEEEKELEIGHSVETVSESNKNDPFDFDFDNAGSKKENDNESINKDADDGDKPAGSKDREENDDDIFDNPFNM